MAIFSSVKDRVREIQVFESDIKRIHAALIHYSASLQTDRSGAAEQERRLLLMLAEDFEIKTMKRKLLILDTNALFHRSRNALKRGAGELQTSYGQPVTGTYGVLNTLFSILEKDEYDAVLPIYDAGGNFRKKESEVYKANRDAPDDSFRADMSLLKDDVLPALGFNPIGLPGYEADDVIASVAKKAVAFSDIDILTCDRDLLGCVSNRVNVILFNSAKKIRHVDIDGVLDIFGVYPAEVRYLKSLSGDSSDNVAGIRGIGDKTAAKIIMESRPQGQDDGLTGADRIALHPKVRENASTFLSNLRVISMVDDLEVKWLASSPPPEGAVRATFEQCEFNSYLKEARFKKICKALKC
jgi:DNA polymerase-1